MIGGWRPGRFWKKTWPRGAKTGHDEGPEIDRKMKWYKTGLSVGIGGGMGGATIQFLFVREKSKNETIAKWPTWRVVMMA
jgi:hypothetical protein